MQRYMIMVAVLLALAGQAAAEDLYTCKTPEGRTIVSNVPCARESHETVIPSGVSSPQVASEESALRQPAASKPTVDAAFKALRKIMAATEVGINMNDYGRLVVEAQAAVNDVVPSSSSNKDGLLYKEIKESMKSYADSLTVYNLTIRDSSLLKGHSFFVLDDEGKKLQETYRFHQSHEIVRRQTALSTIWAVARTHLQRATELAK